MKEQRIQAAYFACLAWGMAPSVRNINEMVRRISTNGHPGKGFRGEDIRLWLRARDTLGIREPRKPDTPPVLKTAHAGYTAAESRKPSRARHKVLESEAITVPIGTVQRTKAPKQPAFDLGAASAPEVDFDRRRLDLVPGLPELLPEPIDELMDIAQTFAATFGYLKDPKKIAKAIPIFTEVLGGMRKNGIPTSVAWQAFREAVIARSGEPLIGGLPKTAWAYLPNGRARYESRPQFDDCSPPCPVPANASPKPRVPGTRAHCDADGDWIVEDIR